MINTLEPPLLRCIIKPNLHNIGPTSFLTRAKLCKISHKHPDRISGATFKLNASQKSAKIMKMIRTHQLDFWYVKSRLDNETALKNSGSKFRLYSEI